MPGFDDINTPTTSATSNDQRNTRDTRSEVSDAREEVRTTSRSLMATAGRRFANNGQNMNLDQVEAGIREALEKYTNLKDDIHVVKIGTSSLRYPAIALVQKFRTDGVEKATFFMYPIQDRNQALERKRSGDRDGRRDVPPVPTDVIDAKFINTVQEVIRTELKLNDNVDVFCAGQQILGELFKIDHKEHPEGYDRLVVAAVGQTDAVRFKESGVTAGIIQARNLDKDSTIVGFIDYSPSINEDLAGNPIRSDINLEIREVKKKNRNRGRGDDRGSERDDSYNGEAGVNTALIGVDAIVNFIFTGQDDYERRRADDNPQKFLTEIRISNVECRLNPSIANFLYGASQIAAVAQGERWVQAFAPNLIRNKPGRDLGGLYAEQPMGKDPEEPQSLADAKIDEVYEMARYATQPDVLVTFMAPESSEYSRISDQLFLMASSKIGSPEYLEAYDDMMDEFTVMLGHRPDWSDRSPIFVQDQLHRCLIGYYVEDNQYLSSEDIDYLSIVNTGKGLRPLVTAQEWDGSFGLNDYDEGTTKRAQIVSEETDGMIRWTGAQNTLSISMPFLNMLNREFGEVGLGIEVESTEDNSGRRVRRPASNYRDFAGRAEGYERRRNDRDRGYSTRSGGRGGRGGRY